MLKYIHLLFCLSIVFSSIMVSISTNPVQSILFLILTFFQAGFLLIGFHLEFFGLIFIMIYVGAIAILFLFVIMMLNVKLKKENFFNLNKNNFNEIILIGSNFFIVLFLIFSTIKKIFNTSEKIYFDKFEFQLDNLSDIDIFGQILYNNYLVCFLIAGLVLLVALIGAVILTLKFNEIKRKQLSNRQLSRTDKFLAFSSK